MIKSLGKFITKEYDTSKRVLNAYELKSDYDKYFNKRIKEFYDNEKKKLNFND